MQNADIPRTPFSHPLGRHPPQVLARTVAVNRMEGEELTGVIHESVVRQRAFTLQELDLLARLAGLKLAASYGDLSLKIGLGHEDAYRLVACFLKE